MRAWVGDDYAGEVAFRGRNAKDVTLNMPFKKLVGKSRVILAKEGDGRLYYRIRMTHGRSVRSVAPEDAGISISRSYEAIWLGTGTYELTYPANATTIGDFIAPPAKAEEMYTPQTFGRWASDHVIVEAR